MFDRAGVVHVLGGEAQCSNLVKNEEIEMNPGMILSNCLARVTEATLYVSLSQIDRVLQDLVVFTMNIFVL